MNNIDKDIEILNNLIAYLNLLIKKGQHKIFYNNLLWDEKTVDCINALENALAERKQDKERIKELEVLEDDLKDKRIVYVDTPEFAEKFILVQKIKDILQKNRNELFSVTYLDDKQYKHFTMQIDRINKIEKELLEDK